MGQGALPLLRHRLRRHGRGQGRPGGRHPRRHPRRGQSRPQLRQGLLPLQDHVRRRPADHAAAAHADGEYAKDGEFTPVSWDQAFDVMAEKFKAALKAKGPSGVGMFGSGQWTIWEGYAANKLIKGGFRSNNLDPNARHCMASAAFGFMRTFGMDEPMGCYDDIEAADAFVLWGSNMAEMHPILWTRVTDRRLSYPHVKVAVLSTFEHRSFDLADIPIVFTPQTDLAILNYIARHIIKTGRVNQDFVDKHTIFRRGNTDIGYGLRPEHPLEQQAANAKDPAGSTEMTFDEFAAFVDAYDGPMVVQAVGRAGEPARGAGRALRRPQDQGHVVLDHGVQPAHARRLGEPDGLQPAPPDREDQRARQQPVLAHRPALGLRHRARGRHLLAPPAGRPGGDQPRAPPARRGDLEAAARAPSTPKPGYHAVEQNRKLKDGELLAYWVQVNNNMQAGGQHERGGLSGLPQPGHLHRRLRRLSDRHHAGRRPDPADRDVGREGGRLRQRRAAHPFLAPAGRRRPARRAPTSGSWSSSASGSRSRRSGPRSCWPRRPSARARRSTTCCTATARSTASR